MKAFFIGGALALALGTAAAVNNAPPDLPFPTTVAVNWLSEYGVAEQAARQSGKPVFVVFRCER